MNHIEKLKKKARRAHESFHRHLARLDYGCGIEMTCHINPEAYKLRKQRDEAFEELAEADPTFAQILRKSQRA